MTELIWSFSPWAAFLMGVRVGNVYWGAGWPRSWRSWYWPGP